MYIIIIVSLEITGCLQSGTFSFLVDYAPSDLAIADAHLNF